MKKKKITLELGNCILEFEDGTIRTFREESDVSQTIEMIRKNIRKKDHMFSGKRVDNGEFVRGRSLFYLTKYKKDYLMIGSGIQNGSVNGHEVFRDSIT